MKRADGHRSRLPRAAGGLHDAADEARDTAMWLAGEVAELEAFRLISDGSQLPVFAFALRPGVEEYTAYDVSEALRVGGWIVPAYPMPPAIEDLAVLRVCVRNGFSRDLASMLLDDLQHAVRRLGAGVNRRASAADDQRAAFHH